MLPSAHPRLQPKRHLDRFSHFCTAHRSVVGHAQGIMSFPLKNAERMGRPGPPSNAWFQSLSPPEWVSEWVSSSLTAYQHILGYLVPDDGENVMNPPESKPRWHLDRFSRYCTVHGRQSLYFATHHPFPIKITPSHGDVNLHLIHDYLGPSEPTTQTVSRSVKPFLHRWPQNVPILYNGTLLCPSKLPLPMWDVDLHLMRGSLDPPESSNRTASRSIKRFLHGSLVWQTDRPTDHATRSVTIGPIYVHSTAMRPNNNNIGLHISIPWYGCNFTYEMVKCFICCKSVKT